MVKEIWKPVKGFEGSYEVSNCGRVRSLDKVIVASSGEKRRYRGKIRALRKDRDGYLRFNTTGGYAIRVHQAALEAFVGPKPKNCQVCHNNGKRDDNRIENLRWGTVRDNAEDRLKHGTGMGEACRLAKLTEVQARAIKTSVEPTIALASKYGVVPSTIDHIRKGRSWRHLDY